jgi:chromosome segregation ATPase
MWIWWIISLIVLIACFIFAYKAIVSSFDFLPADKRSIFFFKRDIPIESTRPRRSEAMWEVEKHLQKVEENSTFYELQFTKLQERLKALEAQLESQPQKQPFQKKEEEEDWKELYYEENEAKEKLENELDATKQKLEEVENKLNSFEENNTKWNTLKSDYDARLNDLQSMQSNLGLLERKLEAASSREKELELSLLTEIKTKKQYAQLDSNYAAVKSENEDLRRQIVELNKKEREMKSGVSRLKELESRLAIYEEEKAKMIANLEQMVNQNKIFNGIRHS